METRSWYVTDQSITEIWAGPFGTQAEAVARARGGNAPEGRGAYGPSAAGSLIVVPASRVPRALKRAADEASERRAEG